MVLCGTSECAKLFCDKVWRFCIDYFKSRIYANHDSSSFFQIFAVFFSSSSRELTTGPPYGPCLLTILRPFLPLIFPFFHNLPHAKSQPATLLLPRHHFTPSALCIPDRFKSSGAPADRCMLGCWAALAPHVGLLGRGAAACWAPGPPEPPIVGLLGCRATAVCWAAACWSAPLGRAAGWRSAGRRPVIC